MKKDARFQQFLIDPTVKTAVKIDGLTGASKKLGLNDLQEPSSVPRREQQV